MRTGIMIIADHRRPKNGMPWGNSGSRRPLTLLPDNRQQTIRRFLREIPPEVKPRIREICIDMETMLLTAAAKEMPDVPVVIDHFHVI